MNSPSPPAQTTTERRTSPPIWLRSLWIVTALALATGAILWIRHERFALGRQWESHLSILADERATLVRQWINERQGDGRILAGLPTIRELASAPGAGPARSKLERSAREVFARMAETYAYRAIAVFDAAGQTAAELGEPILEEGERMADAVRRSGHPQRAAIAARREGGVTVAIAEPVLPAAVSAADASASLGVVVLVADPASTLFRAINSNPLPALTDDAYIVIRQGGAVRSVSPRRLLPSSLPPAAGLNDSNRVGPAALRAPRQFGEFLDDRGRRVLAATRFLPDLGWGIVVQIDQDEAWMPLTENAVWIGVTALALLLCVTALSLAGRRAASAEQYRQLAQRDARYRTLLEEVRDGVVVEQDGEIVLANPATIRMFGAPGPEEIAGRRFLDLITPESQDLVLSARRARLAGEGAPDRYEVVAQRLDGSRFDLEITAAPMEFGGRTALQAILRDITRRREMEEALRRSEERYRLLFERNLAGVYRSTPEGLLLDCNEAFARILGYPSPRDAMAQPAASFYTDPLERHRLLEELEREGTLTNFETRARRRDGSEIWILEKVSMVEGDDEHPNVLEGMLIDISERKRVEEELRRSELRHRTIFDFAPIGIFQSRRDGSLVTANPKLAEILGYDSPEELLRVNLREVYAEPARREELLIRAEEATAAARIELEWKRRDGARIWVDVNAHTIRDERGNPMFEGFVQDVTERHAGEEERRALGQQLAQSQKIEAVGQLAGGIAHDFNNLLTSIIGYTELLMSSLAAEDPRRSHAEQIRRSAERAASLTQQLLAFSRRQVLEPKVLDLNGVVSGMEEMLRRLIGEHIELRTRRARDLWPVRADPGQLEQAILNLAVNARDAMPDGGRLTIETANADLDPTYASAHMPIEPGRYAMVAVTDSGMGMAPEVRARLFEPFFTTKEQGRGTGLGLSTTYGIVKQSGGYIWCYSEPGKGTSFKIYLPRADEAAVSAPPAAPSISAASLEAAQETILLVEDEPEVRSLVQRLLKLQGYTVVAAANPDEALAIIRNFIGHIDLMVSDVVMPGMSGRQLAERLATTHPELKVLFMSGYTDDSIVHHGILDPGTAFLQKPFTPQALARKVREVIEAPPDQFKVS